MRRSIVQKTKLGEGAFSTVYLVEDERGRRFACKESRELKLLRREAEWLRTLKTPLFPAYEELQIIGEKGYLWMEYVEGETLEQVLRKDKSLSLWELFAICRQLSEGLLLLHEREIPLLYRDLKPENMMYSSSGELRLVDLGLLTEAGENPAKAGSPGYGAPEQFCVGSLLTPGVDVYGFGRTLQRLLNNVSTPIGNRRTGEKIMRANLHRLVELCTRREVSGRIPSMRLVRDVLRRIEGEAGLAGGENSLAEALLSERVRVEQSVFLP